MVAKTEGSTTDDTAVVRPQVPTAAEVASSGLTDSRAYCRLAGSLCNDLLNGSQKPKVVNSVVRAAHMGLRAAEIEQKNDGTPVPMG